MTLAHFLFNPDFQQWFQHWTPQQKEFFENFASAVHSRNLDWWFNARHNHMLRFGRKNLGAGAAKTVTGYIHPDSSLEWNVGNHAPLPITLALINKFRQVGPPAGVGPIAVVNRSGYWPDDYVAYQAVGLTDQQLQVLANNLPAQPMKTTRSVDDFVRNPYVVEFVRRRANGYCEECGQAAPFVRRHDGRPYLEVHHRTRLADGGDDTIANTVALCPNCHRRMHYG